MKEEKIMTLTLNERFLMSDRLLDGTTDWHNWMRDTMKIDPNDKRTIEIVWACIVRCHSDFENKFCSVCAKNTEQANQPE